MDYTPHTEQDIREMLQTIGVSAVSDLFDPIPESLRLKRPLDIPPPLTESEVVQLLEGLALKNTASDRIKCFAGGGSYDHFVPAAVRSVAYRSEFVTSYTPYQPELSQGVLGALFEFQSLICELTDMDVSNASLYDGASALVEAVNLATAATARTKIVISRALNPNYIAVMQTFGKAQGYEFEFAEISNGTTDVPDLNGAACFVVAHPNFFGSLEDVARFADAAHAQGALLIVHFDPLSAGLLESPGKLGADVVTAEGQSLGNELNFGGPYLGIFATRMEHVRRVPGRIVGATVDVSGNPGFVLTLQAREQHIRREKANSNVCTNQTLMAVVATVYLSWLGPQGIQELGKTCMARAHYAAEILASVPGCALEFSAPFFKEFVLRLPRSAKEVQAALVDRGYLIGPTLESVSADMSNNVLVAVTEQRTTEDIEDLAKALAEVVA